MTTSAVVRFDRTAKAEFDFCLRLRGDGRPDVFGACLKQALQNVRVIPHGIGLNNERTARRYVRDLNSFQVFLLARLLTQYDNLETFSFDMGTGKQVHTSYGLDGMFRLLPPGGRGIMSPNADVHYVLGLAPCEPDEEDASTKWQMFAPTLTLKDARGNRPKTVYTGMINAFNPDAFPGLRD